MDDQSLPTTNKLASKGAAKNPQAKVPAEEQKQIPTKTGGDDFCYKMVQFAFAKTVEQFSQPGQSLELMTEINQQKGGNRCSICKTQIKTCGCLSHFIRKLTLGATEREPHTGNAGCSSYQRGYQLRKNMFKAERSLQTLQLLMAEHRQAKARVQRDCDDIVADPNFVPVTAGDGSDSETNSLPDIDFEEVAEDFEGDDDDLEE